MASSHERVLAAEWLAVMAIETLDALSGATTGKFKLPSPSRYFATMIVYLMLGAAAMFGEKPGKLAAAFGGVAALTIVAAPRKDGGPSPVLGALHWFSAITARGSLAAPHGTGQGTVPTATAGGAPQIVTAQTQTPVGAPPLAGFTPYGGLSASVPLKSRSSA